MKLSDRVYPQKLVSHLKRDSHESSSRDLVLQDVKTRIHYKVLNIVDLDKISNKVAGSDKDLDSAIKLILESEVEPLNLSERELLIKQVKDEVMGYGPIEPLLSDPNINDILVNTYNNIFVERQGILEETNIRFKDDAHLLKIIDKIAGAVGRRVDESSPMVDARLPDGSRVNAVIPPLAIDGPLLSIRKFSVDPFTADDLINMDTFTKPTKIFLESCVKARLNIIISGGTGTGKTTLLNVLSSFISNKERIITIEDSAELQLQQRHVARLETRPPNIEGKGGVALRELVRNSLRMRPDRIVVGEVRGGEALDMMQAMNTGHDGSLTTIHANSPRDALSRLETMISMAGFEIPDKAIRQQVCSAIQIIIQLGRLVDGTRKIVSIQEITGMEGDVPSMQEIFKYKQKGINDQGQVIGIFGSTGIRPKSLERILSFGIKIDNDIFKETVH